MNKRSVLGTALIMLSLAASLLIMPRAYAAPAVVGTSPRSVVYIVSNTRLEFNSAGLSWKVYQDEEAAPGCIVYRTSADNVTWSARTILFNSTWADGFAIKFDGTYFHYVRNVEGGDIYYRRGVPEATGLFTWSAAEQTIPDTFSNVYSFPTVDVDTSGHALVGYTDWDGAHYHPYVTMSGNTNGTWGTTPVGYPRELSATSASSWSVTVKALTGGKFVALYSKASTTIRAQCWNGTDWTAESATAKRIYAGSTLSAVVAGDNVEVAFLKALNVTYDILHTTWAFGSNSFTADLTVQANVTGSSNPALARNAATGQLTCFWAGSPAANHFYYKQTHVTHNVTAVKIDVGRYGLPGIMTVGIRAVDAFGNATGPDLTSGIIDGDTFAAWPAYNVETVNVTAYPLIAGTSYAIVVRVPSPINATSGVSWNNKWNGLDIQGHYGDGHLGDSLDSGATWNTWFGPNYDNDDFYFQVMNGVVVTEGQTETDSDYWMSGAEWNYQTFLALGVWDAAPTDWFTDADLIFNGLTCFEADGGGRVGVAYWTHALPPHDVMMAFLAMNYTLTVLPHVGAGSTNVTETAHSYLNGTVVNVLASPAPGSVLDH